MTTTQNPTTTPAEALQIAATIRTQIGPMNLMSCGARDFVGGHLAVEADEPHRPGLRFKASRGLLVLVTLEPTDTYRVRVLRVRKFEYTTLADMHNVYADQVGEVVRTLADR